MLVRILKLNFKLEKNEKFLINLDENKKHIRQASSCCLLELYRNKYKRLFHLQLLGKDIENYRKLFKEVWVKTKIRFSYAPIAWNIDKTISLT